nr:Ku protein [Streptomyces sp. NBC_00691]
MCPGCRCPPPAPSRSSRSSPPTASTPAPSAPATPTPAPGEVAAKPYTLLRQVLSRTARVAVVKYALRGRERLGLLRPVGEALSIQGLHWDDEIRSPAELAPPETEVSEKEIEGALTLMEK